MHKICSTKYCGIDKKKHGICTFAFYQSDRHDLIHRPPHVLRFKLKRNSLGWRAYFFCVVNPKNKAKMKKNSLQRFYFSWCERENKNTIMLTFFHRFAVRILYWKQYKRINRGKIMKNWMKHIVNFLKQIHHVVILIELFKSDKKIFHTKHSNA